MTEELRRESFLHRFAFQRYFRDEALLHPLSARHSDVVPVCALQLHELQQKPQAVSHQVFHLYQAEI